MNISEKLSLKQLEEILISIKNQETKDVDAIEIVNMIKEKIISICSPM
ncbi:hypothetical protein [Fredinandcohnia quinoae]|uniref:Uncharacterized protein n=1 Tax=Fredinandcohnia quinoae TaxID=2918902 RepID=A0AAW5E490_9BACI|nr:hypothetical protein [Fredinandcohnia sp. SECRCQ15]MCH1624897.1 hypothetical protein [Fredinandcohnia sp. SECRCQ15]